MKEWTVGHCYPQLKTTEDMLIRASYDDLSGWEIIMAFPNLTEKELNHLRYGTAQLTFVEIRDRLFLLGKFGGFSWFDTPFEPAIYPRPQNYPILPDKKGTPVILVCADTVTGEVKGLRVMGLSNIMSNALNSACAHMDAKHRPMDEEAYSRDLQTIYKEYPNTEAMLQEVNPAYVTIIYEETRT